MKKSIIAMSIIATTLLIPTSFVNAEEDTTWETYDEYIFNTQNNTYDTSDLSDDEGDFSAGFEEVSTEDATTENIAIENETIEVTTSTTTSASEESLSDDEGNFSEGFEEVEDDSQTTSTEDNNELNTVEQQSTAKSDAERDNTSVEVNKEDDSTVDTHISSNNAHVSESIDTNIKSNENKENGTQAQLNVNNTTSFDKQVNAGSAITTLPDTGEENKGLNGVISLVLASVGAFLIRFKI